MCTEILDKVHEGNGVGKINIPKWALGLGLKLTWWRRRPTPMMETIKILKVSKGCRKR